MPTHVTKPGESLSLIAWRYGFADWKIVYNDGGNADLRKKRPNPDVLHPGDEVFIPELQKKQIACASDQSHSFVVKRPVKRLKVKCQDGRGQALAGQAFTLDLGNGRIEGALDGDGALDEEVPIELQTAVLHLGEIRWVLSVGDLNPLRQTADDGISGLQARLRNLGFDPGPVDGVLGPRTRAALASYQVMHGLEVTGDPDSATLDALEDHHGS